MSVQLFDPNFYSATNPDLKAAGITTPQQLLQHFQTYGLSENPQFSPLVNLNFYRFNNADLASLNNEQLLNHRQQFGITESRQFCPYINLDYYLANHSDVNRATRGNKTQDCQCVSFKAI